MENILFYTDDCDSSYITTPNESLEYVDRISGNVGGDTLYVRHYDLKYSTNCCDSTSILLPVRYPFNINVYQCNDLSPNPGFTSTLSLTGILPSYISNIYIAYDSADYTILTTSSVLTNTRFSFNWFDSQILLNSSSVFYLRLTHVDGFVYNIKVTYSIGNRYCPLNILNVETTYPSLDPRVVITEVPTESSRLSLNALFELDTISAGVYYVSIMRRLNTSSNTIFRSYFISCDVKCDIINKLIQCRTSDIFNFYDALMYSNECSNITYEDKCALYELMYMKLMNDGCIDPYEDCNCSDSDDKFFQRKTKPTNVRITTKKCGCS